MVERMTDERLAELRALSKTESDEWWGLWCNEHDAVLDIDDLSSLLARLDAAEELIREVANSCAHPEFDDARLRWSSVQMDKDTIEQCRSYMR